MGKDLRSPGAEDEPAVGADRARRIAQNQQDPGAEVGDMVLARLHNIGREGPGRLVWIVSFDPDTVPPDPPFGWMGPIETHADGSADYGERAYAVTIVDASTGGVVIGTFNKTNTPDYMRID
ncbi:MAG TPA: hypothetical protein VMR52_03885 [Dehalococcoidia bacterium]|nr:hypothetical protein [Dehalococcoidia bacterium]